MVLRKQTRNVWDFLLSLNFDFLLLYHALYSGLHEIPSLSFLTFYYLSMQKHALFIYHPLSHTYTYFMKFLDQVLLILFYLFIIFLFSYFNHVFFILLIKPNSSQHALFYFVAFTFCLFYFNLDFLLF